MDNAQHNSTLLCWTGNESATPPTDFDENYLQQIVGLGGEYLQTTLVCFPINARKWNNEDGTVFGTIISILPPPKKEVMFFIFVGLFVCLSICLYVNKIWALAVVCTVMSALIEILLLFINLLLLLFIIFYYYIIIIILLFT